MTETRNALVGTWQIDATHDAALNAYGNVTLEFESDGTLRYTIRGTGKDEVILLTYRVEGSFVRHLYCLVRCSKGAAVACVFPMK